MRNVRSGTLIGLGKIGRHLGDRAAIALCARPGVDPWVPIVRLVDRCCSSPSDDGHQFRARSTPLGIARRQQHRERRAPLEPALPAAAFGCRWAEHHSIVQRGHGSGSATMASAHHRQLSWPGEPAVAESAKPQTVAASPLQLQSEVQSGQAPGRRRCRLRLWPHPRHPLPERRRR